MVFIRNIRVVVIASLAIPASLIASFALIRAAGFTLNSMTLLGLTLAVGIVIDDAIVVLENIFRHIEEEGAPPFRAAIDGTKEVTLAVVATSVSLIVIFLPVAFMTGYTPALHLSVRPDDGVRGDGVAAGQPDADADAERAPAAHRRAGPPARRRILRQGRSRLPAVAGVVAGSPRRHRRDQPARVRVDLRADRRSAARSCPTRTWASSSWSSTRRKGRRSPGTEKAVSTLTPDLLKIDGIAHVMPTDLRAGQSLAHLHPAEAARRAVSGRRNRSPATCATLMASHPGYKPTIVMRTPIGGGESSAYPIQVNLTGPDLRKLSDYALQLLQKVQPMPALSDLEGGGQPVESRAARGRRSAARRRPRRARRRPGAGAAPDGQRRGRDFQLSREGRALPRDDPRAGGSARRHAGDRRPDGAVVARRAGPRRQPRDADRAASARRSSSATTGSSRSGCFADVKPGSPLDQALDDDQRSTSAR